MFGILGKKKKTEFRDALLASLPDGVSIAPEILALIEWLESQNQTYRYRRTNKLFLPTIPVTNIDHLWSHFAFEVQTDIVRQWFGRDDLEAQIIPLLRCGADGSYLALWCEDGASDRYVFLGSEGEAFVVANNAVDFILLITMGYATVEGRYVLEQTPQQIWQEYMDGTWPGTDDVRAWVTSTFNVTYSDTGAALVARSDEGDPFEKFVQEKVAH